MIKCPKCQSENIRFMTSLIISAPIKYYHNLVKEAYTDKDTIIWGVNWGHDIMLSCADCGHMLLDRHTMWDQIDKLHDRIKQLRKALEFYADEDNYPYFGPECSAYGFGEYVGTEIHNKSNEIAKEALENDQKI